MPELPPPPSQPDPLGAVRAALTSSFDRWREPGARAGAALAGVVAVALVVNALRAPTVPPERSLPRATSTSHAPTTGVRHLLVHVAGAVASPGVFRLAPASRVADAVAAAGGPTDDADLDQLNLAAPVADGERIYVARRGEVPPAPSPGATMGPVDLNRATVAELEALPGIGPALAGAIVEWRRAHGRFRSVDDLLQVRGIGEAKLAELRSRVRVS